MPNNKNHFWTAEEEALLQKAIKENKKLKDIYPLFLNRTAAAVAKKRNKLIQANTNITETNLTSREVWTSEQIKKLQEAMLKNKSLTEIYMLFPNKSKSSVRKKRNTMRNEDPKAFGPVKRKETWSHEEIEQIKQAISEGQSVTQICNFLPNRSKSAVKQQVNAMVYNPVLREEKVQALPWAIAQKVGITEIPPDLWPVQRILSDSTSLYALATPSIYSNINESLKNIRDLLYLAEKNNKEGIQVVYASGPEQLLTYLNTRRRRNINRDLGKIGYNLVCVSMLADGTIHMNNNYPSNLTFQLTQAANILGQNNQSHLEYLLSTIPLIKSDALTAGCLAFDRGIPKQSHLDNLQYTWKARLNLPNFKGLSELYKLFYDSQIIVSSKQANALLKLTTHKFQEFQLADSTSLKNIDTFKNSENNLKTIPHVNILKEQFFENPGFTLAHLHQQDGDLLFISKLWSQPRLFIGTKSVFESATLSVAIYEQTKIKYLPRTYGSKTKDQVTVLYMCPSSINEFIRLIEPHMHPCMLYKMPTVIKTLSEQLNQTSNRYDSLFNSFYEEYLKLQV